MGGRRCTGCTGCTCSRTSTRNRTTCGQASKGKSGQACTGCACNRTSTTRTTSDQATKCIRRRIGIFIWGQGMTDERESMNQEQAADFAALQATALCVTVVK